MYPFLLDYGYFIRIKDMQAKSTDFLKIQPTLLIVFLVKVSIVTTRLALKSFEHFVFCL